VPNFIKKSIAENYFDLYLLCYPDLPWVPDPVREHGGDERLFFYDWYKREIELTGVPYTIISGIGKVRTNNAIKAVNKLLECK
jgi:nicotinamide riboside kinase